MNDMPRVDRAELDADRELLARLPDGVACGLPVDRVRRYLDALAAVVSAHGERPASQKMPPRWETVFRKPDALAGAGIELPPPGPMPVLPLAPVQRLRPWRFRELARAPSRGTIVFIIVGVAVLLATSAWQDSVLKTIGEGVVFALVGAKALGITLDRRIRKRGDDEPDDDACDEPGAIAGFLLISGTYTAVAVAAHEGGTLTRVEVSWTGALLVGLLVTLSLALEYDVISAERLALK